MGKDLVRLQVMVPKSLLPLLEKYMRERGYEYYSHAVRRIVVEYISKHYGVDTDRFLSGGSSGGH